MENHSDNGRPVNDGLVGASVAPQLPKWRHVINFPLVALVLSLGGMIGVLFLYGLVINSLQLGKSDSVTEKAVLLVLYIACAVAFYKLVLRHLGDRPRDDLPIRGAFADTGRGVALGFTIMAVTTGMAALAGAYWIAGWGNSTSAAFILLDAGLGAAVLEELVFRGIVFRWLEELTGSWAALALSALLFGFMHGSNPNATTFSSVAIAIEAGILLGGAYMLTRNLWLAIGIHFGWNVTQGYIFDVPVSGLQVDGLVDARFGGNELLSGGAFGLEASIFALIIATGTGIVMVMKAKRLGHIVPNWWARRRNL